jgi:hypothetical protein
MLRYGSRSYNVFNTDSVYMVRLLRYGTVRCKVSIKFARPTSFKLLNEASMKLFNLLSAFGIP